MGKNHAEERKKKDKARRLARGSSFVRSQSDAFIRLQ
jgi:hypothetical protein